MHPVEHECLRTCFLFAFSNISCKCTFYAAAAEASSTLRTNFHVLHVHLGHFSHCIFHKWHGLPYTTFFWSFFFFAQKTIFNTENFFFMGITFDTVPHTSGGKLNCFHQQSTPTSELQNTFWSQRKSWIPKRWT